MTQNTTADDDNNDNDNDNANKQTDIFVLFNALQCVARTNT